MTQQYTGLPERILVVTEKPSSARRIAKALDIEGKPKIKKIGGVSFYTSRRGDAELIVASALGHLYSIVQDSEERGYPVFKMKWTPTNQSTKKVRSVGAFIKIFTILGQESTGFVSACDNDVEGSLIAYNVLRYAVGEHSLVKAGRMSYSTLTHEDLNNSWENRSKILDFPMIAAGKARHEVDWLFGINLSRALTLFARDSSKRSLTLSIGRVQGPTLAFVKKREDEIISFVPIPFWTVYAEAEIDGVTYPLEYEASRIENEKYAMELAESCRGKIGNVTGVHKESKKTPPPPPFNLGDLQREAYRVYRMSPTVTLATAENLYIRAYISYPRTSSQQLPSSINVKEILSKLRLNPTYVNEADSLLSNQCLKPKQGKNDDQAHPAIHPTGVAPVRLSVQGSKVYDLITRRFLACLAEPAVKEYIVNDIDVNGYLFHLKGSLTIKRGWLDYYPFIEKLDYPLPETRVDQNVSIVKLSTQRTYTKPPPRFNASSLLRLMETKGIGTKTTRANVIDTLAKRRYVKGMNIKITNLGYSVVETLDTYCPEILSVNMTRGLEADLNNIQKGAVEAEAVVLRAIEELKPILTKFKVKEKQIGSELFKGLTTSRYDQSLDIRPNSNVDNIFVERKSNHASRSIKQGRQGYMPLRKKEHKYSSACRVCNRAKIEGSVYCIQHSQAYSNLEKSFAKWQHALGLAWEEYLENMIKAPGVGRWARDVASNILSGF